MSTPEEDEVAFQVESHKRRSAGVLRRLTAAGVPLDAPRSVIFHFWSPNQKDAALLSRMLYERGYLVLEIARGTNPDGDSAWKVDAGVTWAPEMAGHPDVMEELIRLAIAFRSEFDGWGVPGVS
jgi:hypothetical protein